VWVWGGVWVVDPRKVVGFRLPCLLALLFLLLSPSALASPPFILPELLPFLLLSRWITMPVLVAFQSDGYLFSCLWKFEFEFGIGLFRRD
jgi:hypothetical protein